MDRMDYFLELYGTLPRAGPGDDALTRRAFELVRDLPTEPRILDIGCGPGMQTVELLRLSGGTVVALDLLPTMLARTRRLAEEAGFADRLETVERDMHEMDFEPSSFDLVWSEGALYLLGFSAGLERLWELVRPGGFVAVSDAVWLRPDPPGEAVEFWKEYPEIDSVENKLAVLSAAGYEPVGHFILPPECWTRHYYDHLARRITENASKWAGVEVAEEVLAEARNEIDIFHRCSKFYSYAFFVMRRPARV